MSEELNQFQTSSSPLNEATASLLSGLDALKKLLGEENQDNSPNPALEIMEGPKVYPRARNHQSQSHSRTLLAEEGASLLYQDKHQNQHHHHYDVGYQLNQYDSELIKGHYLEKLKNPLHRLMAQKHRLSLELEQVETELTRYEKIKASGNIRYANPEKIEGLKIRKSHIDQQLYKINAELSQHNPFFGMYQGRLEKLVELSQASTLLKPLQKLILKVQNYLDEESTLGQLQENFDNVQEILSEHLHDPTAISPEQFTALIFQYDKDIITAERKAEKLRKQARQSQVQL